MKDELIKNVVNCWCYMHGSGWEKNGGDGAFQVPFPDVYVWGDLVKLENSQGKPNIGALNVYKYWETNKKPSIIKIYNHFILREAFGTPLVTAVIQLRIKIYAVI